MARFENRFTFRWAKASTFCAWTTSALAAAISIAASATAALGTGTTTALNAAWAAVRSDRAVDTARATDQRLLSSALEQRDDLVARAAELGRGDAVRLLVELGFDVNVRHRTTALHEAALRGNLQLAKLLVELGADLDVVDTEWDSPPAGFNRRW